MKPAAARRLDRLLSLPRGAKKALAITTDVALCILTVWLSICFRFESWVSLSGYQWLAVAVSILLAIPLLVAFGFYHTVIRFVGKQTIIAALRAIGIYAVIYSAVFTAYGFPQVPRAIGVLQPLLLLISLALMRLLASQLLSEHVAVAQAQSTLPAVLIYGAGNSGQQLAASLQANGENRVIGFLDDNTNLHNARIAGTPVYAPQDLDKLCESQQVRSVFLAMPLLDRSRRNEIIKLLGRCKVAVRTLPSLKDLASGRVSEKDLRELDIEDLLSRDPVAPIPELMVKNITDKVVMVTGAGGSIGSELCRQIVALAPTALILIDLSEFALYTINEEIQHTIDLSGARVRLLPILSNVQDEVHVNRIFDQYRPNTVYHAAAYKHVPLVESNPLAGLRNNVLGTWNVAQAAVAFGTTDMVLISTDKAVRPTNIMGASKRIAEIVLQALASAQTDAIKATRFCIVRFGNVLASSGSVIPKFRDQIRSGGPVTVTHRDVTRYFMTIPEAAQLVIQAGAMPASSPNVAQVFLLDMGKSVKIMDLAVAVIHLSGLTVRDDRNPNGDIPIVTTGLRPGEKLYEELLVSGDPKPTLHPKIVHSIDPHPSLDDVRSIVQTLQAPNAVKLDTGRVRELLAQLDLGYSPTD